MTREEAIEHLKNMAEHSYPNEEYLMAIKALEQEPCEDAISRQAALDSFGLTEKSRKYGGDHSGYDTIMLYEVQDALEALPPVQPQPKTGHWIDEFGGCECSECGCLEGGHSDYCPNCGAKMAESEVQDADSH